MDSMKHLTLYILARRLSVEECKRLCIPEKYAWENFMNLYSQDRRQECYNLLYNSSGVDLISNLDTLFGTRNFNFKLKGVDNHMSILKLINDLQLSELEGCIDILGTLYENHLGSGSNKSAMRDLGQFFTDRKVCKYMTSLCEPKHFPDGRVESVLDPTMGTAGFLTSYVNSFREKGIQVDWSKMQSDLAGYDIDEFVMSVGKINMYLSTGVLFNRIDHRDTLHTDVGKPTERLSFKVILANMPFGVKGLIYKDCCARVKALGINGTKSEPLFLNLMMASLDLGGRCAVVVPDGVLVNNSNQHNGTRKYLLDHFELKRVIKMKGQFFSNTDIQPSILFFENTGNPTRQVEFWDVEQNADGTLNEQRILSVDREKFDEGCSLDVRRYQETTAVHSGNSYPSVKLGDILTTVKGPLLTLTNAVPGNVPLYSASVDVKSHNQATFDATPSIIQACVGSNLENCIHYTTTAFAATANLWVLRLKPEVSNVLLKYVYYTLKLSRCILQKVNHSVLPKVTKGDFDTIELVIPPLEIQDEIVKTLDRMYANAENAKQTAISMKTQIASVVRSMAARGYETKSLGDCLSVFRTGRNQNDLEDGEYPFYMANGVSKCYSTYQFDGEYVLNGRCGTIGDSCYYVNGKFSASDFTYVLQSVPEIFTNKYLYYFIKYGVDWNAYKTGSTMPNLPRGAVVERLVAIPPMSVQQQVVAMLDEMETERKSLEQMTTKVEERAKFILDGYLTPPPPVVAVDPAPVADEPPKKRKFKVKSTDV